MSSLFRLVSGTMRANQSREPIRKGTAVWLSLEMQERIDEIAKRYGVSRIEVVRETLKNFLPKTEEIFAAVASAKERINGVQ